MDPESGMKGVDANIRKLLAFGKRRKIPVACCGIVAFVVLILFCTSFRTVGPYNYGLIQNTVSKRVSLGGPDSVYEPGVYFVGFWYSFLNFPSTIQTIQYSFDKPENGVQHSVPLHLRSRDAVPLHLEVSVQYLRKKDELPKLFQQAMTPMLQENIFISTLRAELTKVMSQHNVADCWTDREALVREFKAACDTVLDRAHAVCWGLQFYRVHVAKGYENELITTQVQKQRRKIELARKNAAEVRANTQVLMANYSFDMTVIRSQAEAERYNLQVAARTEAASARVQAEADALAYVLDTVKLPNGTKMTEAQLTEYQEALLLGDSLTASPLYVGLSGSPSYIAVPGGSSGRRLATKEAARPLPSAEPEPAVPLQEL